MGPGDAVRRRQRRQWPRLGSAGPLYRTVEHRSPLGPTTSTTPACSPSAMGEEPQLRLPGRSATASRFAPRLRPCLEGQDQLAKRRIVAAWFRIDDLLWTLAHAEMSTSSARISIHELEYSLMLCRPCRRSSCSFFHRSGREIRSPSLYSSYAVPGNAVRRAYWPVMHVLGPVWHWV
jgi:hypothetical protein